MEKLLNQKTLMISSLTPEGVPFISYAPFVKVEERIYIYISETAEHYQNVCKNPQVAIIIIEDEKDAKSTFARTRVSFNATAKQLETIDERLWELFERKQDNEILKVLRTLDFHMFELDLHQGRLVEGFGRAYNLVLKEGSWIQEQITSIGHK